jgi:hypothetical protein
MQERSNGVNEQPPGPAGQALRTPRAAAIAGIVFALLFALSIGLMRLAIPEGIAGPGGTAWLQNGGGAVRLALTLVPFAGIAFLWFMGVIRNRLGRMEDQFFSTVFYGSGLLFLAMMFCSAAIAGGLLSGYELDPNAMTQSGVITFARTVIYTVTNVYAIRMAGVFMLSLGTIWVRTRVMPRVFVIITYVLAVILLVAINLSLWVIMVFPAWVFAISLYILIESLRGKALAADAALGAGE